MTESEAYENLTTICAPFEPVPIIGRIMATVPEGDLVQTHYAVTRALADPRIQRAGPLYDRLASWEASVTGRQAPQQQTRRKAA